MNLSTWFGSIARSQPNIICNEVSCQVSRSEKDLSFLWCVMSSWRGEIVVASLLSLTITKINSGVQYPGICGTCIKKSSYWLWRVSNEHLRNVSIILKIILSNMGLNFLSSFIDWAMSDIIDSSLSLCLACGLYGVWLAAAIQLNVQAIDRSWLRVLLNSSQVELQMTFCLRKTDWLSVGANISSFLRQGIGLLNSHDVDGLGSLLNIDYVEECSNCKRDLH